MHYYIYFNKIWWNKSYIMVMAVHHKEEWIKNNRLNIINNNILIKYYSVFIY